MSEVVITPEIQNTENTVIVFIRHGETSYTGKPNDLTPVGVAQIQQTSDQIQNFILGYDTLRVLNSPKPRARYSAQVFLQQLGIHDQRIITVKLLDCFQIYDLALFRDYGNIHAVSGYDLMWLHDPVFAQDSDHWEGRFHVVDIFEKFLAKCVKQIQSYSEEIDQRVCVVVFTHFENVINYLLGIFPGHTLDTFPSHTARLPSNAEPVVVELTDVLNDTYTIHARNKSKTVRYDFDRHFFREP